MNAIVKNIAEFALKKYKEPSTWIPIVSAIGLWMHSTVPPDLQNAIAGAFASIVAALFVALNEHAPAAAPLQPTAPVVDGGVHESPHDPARVPTATANSVSAGSGSAVRPSAGNGDGSQPHPIRPGIIPDR